MKPRDSGLDERGVCSQGLTGQKSNHKAVLSPQPRGSHQRAPLSSPLKNNCIPVTRLCHQAPLSKTEQGVCPGRSPMSHLICPAQQIFSTAKRSFSCCSLGRVLKCLFYPGTLWLRCLKNFCLTQRQNLSPKQW